MIAYEQDYLAWLNQQVGFMRSGQFQRLDVDNLAEEIEAMGRSEKRELEHRMIVLLVHLLKWQYQPTYRGNSWQYTILEQRRQIQRLIKNSPSLKSTLKQGDWLEEVWELACLGAAKETGLRLDTFPNLPIWDVARVLSDFLPDDLD